jgi:hypothetical protein
MEPTTTPHTEATTTMADSLTSAQQGALAYATHQARVQWSAYAAVESAADSAVYDLAAYDQDVPASMRYVAIGRDASSVGHVIVGHYADPDVANLAALNRRAVAL